jgi:hypothetical protein
MQGDANRSGGREERSYNGQIGGPPDQCYATRRLDCDQLPCARGSSSSPLTARGSAADSTADCPRGALASACLEDAFFPVTGLRMLRRPGEAAARSRSPPLCRRVERSRPDRWSPWVASSHPRKGPVACPDGRLHSGAPLAPQGSQEERPHGLDGRDVVVLLCSTMIVGVLVTIILTNM